MFSGICIPSCLGPDAFFAGHVFTVSDIDAIGLIAGMLAAGRKATDVVTDAALVLCGEVFASVFIEFALGCPCIEAGLADITTSGTNFVVVLAFNVVLDVDVPSWTFCFDVAEEACGLLILVIFEAALRGPFRGDVMKREAFGCEMAFDKCEVCFCLFPPLADDDEGNPGGG